MITLAPGAQPRPGCPASWGGDLGEAAAVLAELTRYPKPGAGGSSVEYRSLLIHRGGGGRG